MTHIDIGVMMISRVLVSAIFLLIEFGIIDQSIRAKEMVDRGVPQHLFRFRTSKPCSRITSPFPLTGFFNGGKVLRMVSTPCLDSLLQLQTVVAHDTLETGMVRSSDGRQIAICGFTQTMASFLRVLFSSKPGLVATSTTGHCGPATSFESLFPAQRRLLALSS
jgi:hypothetical protein